MAHLHIKALIILALSVQLIYSTKEIEEQKTKPLADVLNPMNYQTNNEYKYDSNGVHTTEKVLRVKRQYYPYDRRPIPIPIIIGGGGWYGGRGFGGRGFGGRGFGGRGFGGRGFGGRGFGGRGFGGRGFGGRGFGGRGFGGGGFGGRGIGGGRGGRGK